MVAHTAVRVFAAVRRLAIHTKDGVELVADSTQANREAGMLYVSQLPPDQLVALEFRSGDALTKFLTQLPAHVDYSVVSEAAVIIPKAHERSSVDRAESLGLKFDAVQVLNADQVPAEELAKSRRDQFRKKPDAATRKKLIESARAAKAS